MYYNVVYVFDADQYPVRNWINNKILKSSLLIAAANDENKLCLENGQHVGQVVPCIPEAADAYLVAELNWSLLSHQIDEIVIATRDKKLISMLIIVALMHLPIKIKMHSCCTELSNFLMSVMQKAGMNIEHISDNYDVSDIEQEIMVHISSYPLGLKLKTLAYHYDCSVELMENVVCRLEHQHLVKHIDNVYCCDGLR